MSDAELNKTLERLSSISFCARRKNTFEFTSLAHHLNVGFLKDCYARLDRNKAVGIDKVSWQKYGKGLDNKLATLVAKLKGKTYKPLPSRRVYIPKGNNAFRPLGISAIENKIVESGIARIIGSIYESKGVRANIYLTFIFLVLLFNSKYGRVKRQCVLLLILMTIFFTRQKKSL